MPINRCDICAKPLYLARLFRMTFCFPCRRWLLREGW